MAWESLFQENNKNMLPVFKMELILDDDDNMQFYPVLSDVEGAVLHVVDTVASTMQGVPTVQVIHHVMSRHVTSPHITISSYDLMSHHVMLCHVNSHRITYCHFMSHHITYLSPHVMSCHVMSQSIQSHYLLSHQLMLHHLMVHHITLAHTTSLSLLPHVILTVKIEISSLKQNFMTKTISTTDL